jgi:hypothetical protein
VIDGQPNADARHRQTGWGWPPDQIGFVLAKTRKLALRLEFMEGPSASGVSVAFVSIQCLQTLEVVRLARLQVNGCHHSVTLSADPQQLQLSLG